MKISKKKILIADDEEIILNIIKKEFVDAGYDVDLAIDGEEASNKIAQNYYDSAILDIRMPKKNGIKVLKEIREKSPATIVILMTAFGTIENVVEAMKIGAYDYIAKPFDSSEILEKVEQGLKFEEKVRQFKDIDEEDEPEIKMIGNSQEIIELRKKIRKIKNIGSTILITGESGTGKGVVAKAIHSLSKRKLEPFIHVNCAVLPENLVESELFGYEKGAFTGANGTQKGKFELAGKGTVFLDEINTLSPKIQAKLLIVLQERKIERLGGHKSIPVKSTIIAATNGNLEEEIRLKRFREDLYYRLNVITIDCAPLRYRKEDIEPLTKHFFGIFNRKFNKQMIDISDEVWQIIKQYDWPGNVRELENCIESAMALANEDILKIEDLPLRIVQRLNHKREDPNTNMCNNLLEDQELRTIKKALEKHNGHRENTAKELGISRRTLQYKLKKFNLTKRQ